MTEIEGSAAVAVGIDAAVVANHHIVVRRPEAGRPGTVIGCWALVNRSAPDEVKEAYRRGVMMTFSPTGLFEMDDGENWEQVTNANRGFVTRQRSMYYGVGRDSRVEGSEFPGEVHANGLNDANQRAFYRHWAELLADRPATNGPAR
jgi:ethylbenzene dioxygenase subunit alpha